MSFRRLTFYQSFILLIIAVSASVSWGQSGSTSALTGSVSDPSGARIPGVTVTATSVATNQTRTVVTAEDGVYRIPLLEPGEYNVKFSLAGFKTAEIMGVKLVVTETSVLDHVLQVGAPTEQVTVEAIAETIQTATSALGTTVTGNTITNLPLSSRNFTAVLGMSAGVAVEASNGTSYGRGSQNMSVNGALPEKNNFQMDGVAINNAAGNNEAGDAGLYTGIAIPNPDAIQEFKIQTSTYDASYGRNPGANVNVVTKSGTNELHGSLFEFFRNEALNANDFFYNRDKQSGSPAKQILRQNQFGGSVGGPIKRDKLFFFGSYQGTRQLNGVAGQGTTSALLYPVPDNREAADFPARLGAALCNFPPLIGPKLACDGSNINPVAINLLRVKLPNGNYYIPGSGTSGTVQRLFSIPAKFEENQFIGNGDWVIDSKNTLQAKYMYTKDPFQSYVGVGNGGQLPGRTQFDDRRNQSGVLRLTTIVNPNVVNQARISLQRIIERGTDQVPYTPQQIGMKPLIDASCCNGTTGGTYTQPPVIVVIGAFSIGGGLNPSSAPTNQIQLSDQLSWTKGHHTVRTGYEYEFVQYPLVFGGLGRGFLFTLSFPDLLLGRPACNPADFPVNCNPGNPGNTTGIPSSNFIACLFCVRSGVNGIIHNYAMRNQAGFVQDDWTVNSRLSLNIGLRWERFGNLGDKYGNLTNFWASDLASVQPPSAPSQTDPNAFIGYVVPSNYDSRPIAQGGHGPLPPGVRQFDGKFSAKNRIPLSNFAPRIGLAWQPTGTGHLVVRGGAGIFYDRVGINRMVHAVQEGRPYADTLTIVPETSSLQSPFPDRPLQLLPRWFNLSTLQGSNFDSPFYDHIQTPLVRQYNLGIQWEFVRQYVLEVTYVGSSGINIMDYSHNINSAHLASPSNPINGITTNTAANANARVPYLGFTAQGLQQNGFDGVYNYNSLQATVRKQFSRGHAFQAAYTWSKNLSNVGFTAANVNDPNDMQRQYGLTPYSRPHRFVVSYQYELPFKAGGALGKLVQGWSVSGMTLAQQGTPLTLQDSRGGTVYLGGNPSSVEKGSSTAQLCAGKTYNDILTQGSVKDRLGSSANPSATRFFNSSAFCAPRVIGDDGTATDWGNTGIGIVLGPGQFNTDFSATKMTKIGERQSLQFRAEFFNLFNHAQFSNPSSAPTQIGGGGLLVNNALFGVITSTSVNPRLIQFALRLQF
jgi:Carboxypeptidase regulatory-like domain/TonB-dependent Receptor Plug Domain/TonB dependent receptor